MKRAYKLLQRVLGQPEPGLDDDDLIVESALAQLAQTPEPEARRAIIWDAVTMAMHVGARR